jgi:hypothetical protein
MYAGHIKSVEITSDVDTDRLPMLIESNNKGVGLSKVSNRYGEYTKVMRLKPDYQLYKPRLIDEGFDLCGTPSAYYNWLAYPEFIIPQLLLIKFHLDNIIPVNWHKSQYFVCSEAIWQICVNAGLPNILPGSYGLAIAQMTSQAVLDYVDQKPEIRSVMSMTKQEIQDAASILSLNMIPLPVHFLTSPMLDLVYEGVLGEDWIN